MWDGEEVKPIQSGVSTQMNQTVKSSVISNIQYGRMYLHVLNVVPSLFIGIWFIEAQAKRRQMNPYVRHVG